MQDSIFITSCIRDASRRGGGIASLVLPLHQHLQEIYPFSRLAYGVSPSLIEESYDCVSSNGSGFDRLDTKRGLREVVHIHGLWKLFEYRAYQYAARKKIPVIFSTHGMLEKWAMRNKVWKKYLAWWAYQAKLLNRSNMIIVNSHRERESVRRMGIKIPIAVIENAIELPEKISPISNIEAQKVVLFISRLSPVKGLPDLLNAWNLLSDKNGYQLHIYGYSERGYDNYIRKIINKLNLEDSVKLLGPVYDEEKWNIISNSRFFVLPSYSENFGIVVAEAMYSGLPVITSYQTPWEVLEQYKMGWLAQNNPSDIAKKLKLAIYINDNERRVMSEKAHQYAANNFLWDKVIDKYNQTYEWALDNALAKPQWIEIM